MRPAATDRLVARARVPPLAALAALALLLAPAAHAAPPDCHPTPAGSSPVPPTRVDAADVTLADVTLLDAEGRSVRFKDDVIGERLVVVDFVYTTCTTVCPVLSALMQQVQAKLGERLGRDVHLVTLTVDPTRDIPARMKEAARKHKARAGWTWLTGAPHDVESALRGLKAWSADYVNHLPQVMVGDGRSGRWTRMTGFPSPALILSKVDESLAARAGAPTAQQQP